MAQQDPDPRDCTCFRVSFVIKTQDRADNFTRRLSIRIWNERLIVLPDFFKCISLCFLQPFEDNLKTFSRPITYSPSLLRLRENGDKAIEETLHPDEGDEGDDQGSGMDEEKGKGKETKRKKKPSAFQAHLLVFEEVKGRNIFCKIHTPHQQELKPLKLVRIQILAPIVLRLFETVLSNIRLASDIENADHQLRAAYLKLQRASRFVAALQRKWEAHRVSPSTVFRTVKVPLDERQIEGQFPRKQKSKSGGNPKAKKARKDRASDDEDDGGNGEEEEKDGEEVENEEIDQLEDMFE